MSSLAKNSVRQSGVLPGFEKINRFHNRELDMDMVKILPGEYYVTKSDEIIATVLGSCVSVCIRDRKSGVGGMNHFMLPDGNKNDANWKYNKITRAARYGTDAMEHLVNEIMKHGGKRNNLEFKLCGGGRIMASMNDVGKKNIDFIKNYMEMEGYAAETEDFGSIYPRKVRYFPMTGKLQVMKLRSLHNDTIIKREVEFQQEMDTAPDAGEIELF